MPRRLLLLPALLIASLGLAACQSSEERAEAHYQSSLELLETDDVDRAIVELRNTLRLDSAHRDGRRLFAELLVRQGNEGGAYRQYIRLVEQYPDDTEGLVAVSRLAYQRQDWESLGRFVPAALEQAGDRPDIAAVAAALDWRTAQINEDTAAAAAALERATGLLGTDPALVPARDVKIDALLRDEAYDAALAEIELALAEMPDSLRHHELKLRILTQLQRTDAVGETLQELNRRFPANEQVRSLLIDWYIAADQPAEAETLLRQIAAEAEPRARPDAWATVIEFVRRSRGTDAALAEADRLIAEGDSPIFYQRQRALILAQSGQPDAAIAELRAAIEAAAQSSEALRDARVLLAELLQRAGDEVAARAEVETVLQDQPSHVAALKLRGAWLIEDDRAVEAIAALQTAIEGDPADTATLLLMAQAQLLDGNRQLAGDRLAAAVDVSDQGARESLAYADYLLQSDQADQAEAVLLAALRRSPASLPLTARLGELYLEQGEWLKAENILRHLAGIGTREAGQLGANLRATLLLRQQKTDELRGFLSSLVDRGATDEIDTAALVVRSYVAAGDFDAAIAHVSDLLDQAPNDPRLRFISATLDAATGNPDAAEATLRRLAQDDPANSQAAAALYSLLEATGQGDEAAAVLTQGYAANPGDLRLGLMAAARAELAGTPERAIEIYETLYDRHNGNLVVTNNLASLLSNMRDDPDSLDRAYTLARRLRDSDIPELLDTYGWIALRRGNTSEALRYLERAAEGLPDNPEVLAHLGLAYAEAGRTAAAAETLTAALERAGDATSADLLDQVRGALAALSAPAGDAPGAEAVDSR